MTALRCRLAVTALTLLLAAAPARAADLAADWNDPPRAARLRAYWWWLNGQVTPAAITRDLEQMKARGFGGALICDAGGAEQDGNAKVPPGPPFLSPAWRDLYKHTLAEAERLGLEMSLNIQSGWNLGGPPVKAEDAAKKAVWTEARLTGPARGAHQLPPLPARDGLARDTFVVAYRLPADFGTRARRPIRMAAEKAVHKALHFSAPDTSPLLADLPAEPGEEEARAADVRDLSDRLGPGGLLTWDVPEGTWQVFRFGWTVGDHARVSTSSDGWKGYALDVLDAAAFRRYWDAVVEPLLADAGPRAGTTLRYLHTDSWEVEAVNWTPTLRAEFRARRGYDLVPWLPVLAGRIVDGRDASNRFLFDFRKTLGDLAVAHHFLPFKELAHKHGLRIHPESGGPHAVPVDAQRCLGVNDVPMSEFWARSWRHRVGDPNRFFVKQPASAAHVMGRTLVAAEGFTTIGPHWQERIWNNLKPSFDRACTEGLNLLVWHAVVCSPDEQGRPGLQYFAGTHFNPQTTWWAKSGPFLAYVNRCQAVLQRGLFVADAAYYYGDGVPNFAQLRASDPARVGPGRDYDVVTEEALLTRFAVRDGRLTLPDGLSYRVLVLPDRPAISLPVLRKLRDLVGAGATVIGPRPRAATGLSGSPASDAEVSRLAALLWGAGELPPAGEHRTGRGRVVWGRTADEILRADGVGPDFEAAGTDPAAPLTYLHRTDGDAEVYFVANPSEQAQRATLSFRVGGRAPELWDAVSGTRRFARAYTTAAGRTSLPLELPPCGSVFVVFREPAAKHPATAGTNEPRLQPRGEVPGPWTVHFDPREGGPGEVAFDRLVSWTARPEPGVRFYSGTATYRTAFDAPPGLTPGGRVLLDLGDVRELAEVRLNGRSLGVTWAPPFRVDATAALKPAGNALEVEVVNFWPNRLIGDAGLPPAARRTRTNVRKLTKDTPLMESGLLGPVRLLEEEPQAGRP